MSIIIKHDAFVTEEVIQIVSRERCGLVHTRMEAPPERVRLFHPRY